MESKIDKTLGSRKEWQVPGAGLRGKWGGVRIHLQCRRLWFNSWVRKISWRKDRLPTPVFLGFPDGSISKEFVRHAGDLGSIPGLGRPPGEGKDYTLQYSGLENSINYMDTTEWFSLTLQIGFEKHWQLVTLKRPEKRKKKLERDQLSRVWTKSWPALPPYRRQACSR